MIDGIDRRARSEATSAAPVKAASVRRVRPPAGGRQTRSTSDPSSTRKIGTAAKSGHSTRQGRLPRRSRITCLSTAPEVAILASSCRWRRQSNCGTESHHLFVKPGHGSSAAARPVDRRRRQRLSGDASFAPGDGPVLTQRHWSASPSSPARSGKHHARGYPSSGYPPRLPPVHRRCRPAHQRRLYPL
jgi:hypothetical protein